MTKPIWSSGWNIPGYLPDVEPINCAGWHEARDALECALEQAAEDFAEDDPSHAQLYEAALTQLDNATPNERFSIRVGNFVWWLEQVALPEETDA